MDSLIKFNNTRGGEVIDPLKMMVVTGTRPELIKMSSFLRLAVQDPAISLIFVHSGQHYDQQMFQVFVDELELPHPNYNMAVGSGQNAIQTGKMLINFYKIVEQEHPNVILAQGDTNTVFAAALTAFKMNIPFGHVEAGIRSYDWQMPEEINRVLSSTGALFNFAPTNRAALNLVMSGVAPNRIFLVGNTIVDAVFENLEIAKKKSTIENTLKIQPSDKIILVTAHRPSNVDNEASLTNILNGISGFENIRIIFPIHPRTKSKLIAFDLMNIVEQAGNIEIIDPLGYMDFLKLESLSDFFVTDSGGLQEEAVCLGKPCITLRENTERPETVEIGANVLVGNDPHLIHKYVSKLVNDPSFYDTMIPRNNPFGAGHSARKILDILKSHYQENLLEIPSASYFNAIPQFKLLHIEGLEPLITVGEYEQANNCLIFEIFDNEGNLIFPEVDLILQNGWSLKAKMSSFNSG